MQNIIEICKEFGLEIPADKQSDFNKKVAENYVTKAEHDKKLNRAETDRDTWKEEAETAEETLKGFDGKNLDEITKERDAWKKKAEDAEKDYSDKMAAHEKRELLKEAFAEIEFTSEAAKKAIMSQIEEGVTVKNGKLIGFNDLLEDAKKAGRSEKEKAVKDAEEEIAKLAIAGALKIVSQVSDKENDYNIYEEFLKKAGEDSETVNH